MNHDDLIRHLSYYSDQMIRDFGRDHGRRYLRGCIPVWRDAYGNDLAVQMGLIIKQKLENDSKDKKK